MQRIMIFGGLAVFAGALLHQRWILNEFWPDHGHFLVMLAGLAVAALGPIFSRRTDR